MGRGYAHYALNVECITIVPRGIDYMLEAKLSSGRALEAEQKVEGR